MAKLMTVVAASARTESDIEAVAAAARRLDGSVTAFPLDTTDAASVTAGIDRIESELGPIACSVLNAGTHAPTPVSEFNPETVHALFDVNVMGTVHCLSALFAGSTARRGSRIAVIASLAGYRGLPNASAYGATKAALINMCEALKPELDALSISLQLVNPGFVKTPLTDKNDFPMPFLITADAAAERIYASLQGNKFETAFPRRFAFIMKTLRLLPASLYFALTRRMLQ